MHERQQYFTHAHDFETVLDPTLPPGRTKNQIRANKVKHFNISYQ